ncbi:hypothetical protein RRG08_002674 [Elysia crispata]|uniref:Uncharacterized protein n=1 Tax=Elysia crispata TaxID=231223 RepID=A0AAE1CMC2_9GAST|nr:hypothetical protein RRG08_002674 [Elysia crispata]
MNFLRRTKGYFLKDSGLPSARSVGFLSAVYDSPNIKSSQKSYNPEGVIRAVILRRGGGEEEDSPRCGDHLVRVASVSNIFSRSTAVYLARLMLIASGDMRVSRSTGRAATEVVVISSRVPKRPTSRHYSAKCVALCNNGSDQLFPGADGIPASRDDLKLPHAPTSQI